MNSAQLYQEAIGNGPAPPASLKQEVDEEAKDQKELRYINWNMQQTTSEIKFMLSSRIQELDTLNSSLCQRENTSGQINRNLVEKLTLNKILRSFKTGEYTDI